MRPVLATSTDGVGTKVAIAQAMDIHDTIGFDLVGMVVDDIVVCGAEPLFMTDYIACGKVVPERIAAIVGGIARACEQARVALVGGETAEHPGLLDPDEVADLLRERRRQSATPRAAAVSTAASVSALPARSDRPPTLPIPKYSLASGLRRSASTSSTRRPFSSIAAPNDATVVVLATPPF